MRDAEEQEVLLHLQSILETARQEYARAHRQGEAWMAWAGVIAWAEAAIEIIEGAYA